MILKHGLLMFSRLCQVSPLRSIQLPNLVTAQAIKKKPCVLTLDASPKAKKVTEEKRSLNKQEFLQEVKDKAVQKQLSNVELAYIWKNVVLGRYGIQHQTIWMCQFDCSCCHTGPFFNVHHHTKQRRLLSI